MSRVRLEAPTTTLLSPSRRARAGSASSTGSVLRANSVGTVSDSPADTPALCMGMARVCQMCIDSQRKIHMDVRDLQHVTKLGSAMSSADAEALCMRVEGSTASHNGSLRIVSRDAETPAGPHGMLGVQTGLSRAPSGGSTASYDATTPKAARIRIPQPGAGTPRSIGGRRERRRGSRSSDSRGVPAELHSILGVNTQAFDFDSVDGIVPTSRQAAVEAALRSQSPAPAGACGASSASGGAPNARAVVECPNCQRVFQPDSAEPRNGAFCSRDCFLSAGLAEGYSIAELTHERLS